METGSPKSGLHPMVWVATIAVTAFSAVGIASLTGLLPRHTEEKPVEPAVVATAPAATPTPAAPVANVPAPAPVVTPAPVEAPKPAPKPVVVKPKPKPAPVVAQHHSVPPSDAPPPPAVYSTAPQVCHTCATIESVRGVTQEGSGSGVGAVAGGVVGGLLGQGVGNGRGRDLATVAGVVGGALLGNKIEKDRKTSTSYETVVRFENGDHQTITSEAQPPWREGDKVRVENGRVVPR